MSSTNKKGAGLILSLLTAVAGAVGLGFCIVNAGTDSFRKIGTSPREWLQLQAPLRVEHAAAVAGG